MKKVVILGLLITVLCAQISFAQTSFDSFPKEVLMPIPSWLQEGVCAVYETKFGGRVGSGAEGSSTTLSGYSIYIATSIQGERVYGFIFDVFADTLRGEWSINPRFQVLNTLGSGFYLHPKVVEKALNDRDLYARYGTTVEGGYAGDDLYYFAITTRSQDEVTTTLDQFRSDGIIQKSTITRQSPNGAEAGDRVLVDIANLPLPRNVELPEVARRDVTYAVGSGAMGMMSYVGTLIYRFVGVEGKITHYDSTATLNYGTSTSKVVGDAYFGPFYINPVLLNESAIFTVPQIGFSMDVTSYGQGGRVLVTITVSGHPLAQYEYEPDTGLLLRGSYASGGMTIFLEIQ
ncbi:MAG: hypothetical protein ABDK94_03865 [Atribacterota bacterium]